MLMIIARKVYLTVHSEQEMHCLVEESALALMRHHLVSELASMQAFDSLHSAAVAVWHLQRVLAKKRDPLSHTLFSDALEAAGAPSPLEHFWCAPSFSSPRRLQIHPYGVILTCLQICDLACYQGAWSYAVSRQQLWVCRVQATCSVMSSVCTFCAELAGVLQKDGLLCREMMTAALRRAFADAAGGGRAGTLKDIMTAQYARLAQALEDVIARLIQDTEVLRQAVPLLFCALRLPLQALRAVQLGHCSVA